ncbi:uncharacterized protein LOC114017806 [Falco cherrug]|uniref:uncharacterized protein LOC114017806 n=1 Tax=Falco cherrug TaxID=345164 RepID=UPI0024791E9E|nr:uncharacterized protein LOC114017806 [Falco cherrug]
MHLAASQLMERPADGVIPPQTSTSSARGRDGLQYTQATRSFVFQDSKDGRRSVSETGKCPFHPAAGGNLDGSVVRQNTELCGCPGKGKQVFSGVCQGCLVRNLLSRDASKPAPSRAPETAEDGKNQGVNQGQHVDSAFFLRVFAKPLWSLLYFPTSHLFKTGAGYFPCRLQSSCSLKNNPCCFKMCRRRTRPPPGCSREALTDPVSSFEVLWSKAMESIFLAGRHLQCGHFKDGIGTWTSCQPQMCDHQATGLIQSCSFDVSSKCQHLYRQTHRQVD